MHIHYQMDNKSGDRLSVFCYFSPEFVQDKIFSIFETHTDLLKRGKVRKPIEFGHKIFLAESGNGLVTDYQILDGNPSDTAQVARSLEHHKKMFGTVPELYAGDRGFYSPEVLQACQELPFVTFH